MSQTAALDLAALLRPELAELSAYLPDLAHYAVRLDANEAPPLLSSHARERLARAAAELAWERYPDPTARELREAIAARCGVSREEILVGVGSDEVIALLITALARPRGKGPVSIVTTTPSFVMYRLSARVRGMQVVEVPLDGGWDLATESLARAVEMTEPNVVFIASPNNPTGNMASRDRLARVIESARGALVVIDEAYVDYASRDQLDLYRKHPNVAVLRTLSKVGFASLRLGWVIARPELVRELDKARLPYNTPMLSQRLATVALTELADEIRGITRLVVEERESLAARVAELPGFEVTPREANFLWVRCPRPAGELYAGLCQRGVLVRSFHEKGGRLANQLRVTVGTREENARFLAALGEAARA
jgi:histidinol-phosphate aminotransferase